MSDKKTPKHVTFADDVAKRLIEMLEQGTAPWQRPWETTPALAPYNPTTGKEYTNTNHLWLSIQSQEDPRWMASSPGSSTPASSCCSASAARHFFKAGPMVANEPPPRHIAD